MKTIFTSLQRRHPLIAVMAILAIVTTISPLFFATQQVQAAGPSFSFGSASGYGGTYHVINATGGEFGSNKVQFTTSDNGSTYTATNICSGVGYATTDKYTISNVSPLSSGKSQGSITTSVSSTGSLGVASPSCPGWPTNYTGTVTITGTNPYPNATTPPPAGGAAGAPQSPTCETNGNALAWVLCPVYDMLSNGANEIFNNVVEPFLYTSPISTNASDPSFKTWSEFRIYGDIFLVLALLITVIAQSIGGGMIDAYTVKKILPRVLITAILINLSVYIVAFLVDITNVIGKSLGSILTAPLQSAGTYHISPGSTLTSLGVFAIGLLGLFLVAGHFTGFFGALSSGKAGGAEFGKSALILVGLVLLPIFLAILAVFITLIVRKGLILFLIMISPVAFALYVLPNTEQYFKKWWDLLIEALMVYPIIVAIFAIADILGVTILSANGVTGSEITPDSQGNIALGAGHVFAVVIAFFIQFLPLIAIPFAFRMAGGTLSRMHDAVTSANGKLKQSGWYAGRREKAQQRYTNAKVAGQRDWYTNKLERLGEIGKQENSPWLARRYRRRAITQLERVGGTESAMEHDRLKAIQDAGKANDGDTLKAGLYKSYDQAVDQLQKTWHMDRNNAMRAAAAWQSMGIGWGGASSGAALQAAIEDGTVFTGDSGMSSFAEQSAAIAAVGGHDESTVRRLAGAVYAGNKRAGRGELSASYNTVANAALKVARGGTITEDEAAEATFEGMRGMSAAQLGQLKGAGMANGTNAIAHYMQQQNARLQAANAKLASGTGTAADAAVANDAKLKIARGTALIQGAQAAGFYMAPVHVEQIEQAAAVPSGPIMEKAKSSEGDGFNDHTIIVEHNAGTATINPSTNVATKEKVASGSTVGRIIETQGGRQMPGERIDPTTGMPFGT